MSPISRSEQGLRGSPCCLPRSNGSLMPDVRFQRASASDSEAPGSTHGLVVAGSCDAENAKDCIAERFCRSSMGGDRPKAAAPTSGPRSGPSVPLVERARVIAAGFAAGKEPDDYLLTTITGKQLRATLYRRYTKWAATARGRHVRHLRHFAASEWLRRGVPVNQVAVWLGDDPRTVLQVYAHVVGEQHDREALALLNRAVNSGPPRGPRETDQALRPLTEKGGRA